MTTLVSRVVRSTPFRSTSATWETIVELLTCGKDSAARDELLAIAGIASSIISEQAPQGAAIVVTCNGPRTRIYCLYDEDALDEGDANEDSLGFDPLKGDWAVSLPCPANELAWVQSALKKKSERITARDAAETLGESEQAPAKAALPTVNLKAFLGS